MNLFKMPYKASFMLSIFLFVSFSLKDFFQGSLLSEHVKAEVMEGDSMKFTNKMGEKSKAKKTYPINLVINRGNSEFNGYALRINKQGVLMASQDSQFSGCRWELVPHNAGNNHYLLINRGDSDFNGYALRLNINGTLTTSKDTYFSGCVWEFVSVGDNEYLIINRGESDYNGYALRFNKSGVLMPSKDTYYTGCRWEFKEQ